MKTPTALCGRNRAESDTGLGDWYVNRIVVGRTPLLVLISSKSIEV